MEYKKNTLEKIVSILETSILWFENLFKNTKGPIRKIGQLFSWVFNKYKTKIWRHSYNKDGKITAKRFLGVFLTTIFILWMIPITLGLIWQGSLMATTWSQEEIYLMDSQEIDPDGNIHSVRGCFKMPCEEKDAIYFRVSPSLAHTFFSLVDHGGVFYPDYTASVVAPGVNKCDVTSYGIRVKSLMRGWDIFPHMLDATCLPYETNQKFSQ